MRKPRKGKVRCEKQAVTFVSVASVAESCLPATSSPVLSGAEFIAGFKREQVNLSASGKMETGNMGIGWMLAGRGRQGRSSDEGSVMETEPRAWLVGFSNNQQLKAISG